VKEVAWVRFFNITEKTGRDAVEVERFKALAGDMNTILVPIDIDEDGRLDLIS